MPRSIEYLVTATIQIKVRSVTFTDASDSAERILSKLDPKDGKAMNAVASGVTVTQVHVDMTT